MRKIIICFVLLLIFGCKNKSFGNEKLTDDLHYYNPKVKLRGTNLLPTDPESKFKDAAEIYNMNIIRLICGDNEYKSINYKNSFLYGDTDNFKKLKKDHLSTLDKRLEWAKKYNLKVIIDMHHAAGRQWTHEKEYKLHEDFSYHNQTTEFWKQMASYYKDEGDYLMFDLVNEPFFFLKYVEDVIGWNRLKYDNNGLLNQESIDAYAEYVKGTPADLNLLYKQIISAIREIDPDRIIIIEPDYWAGAMFMQTLKPIYDNEGKLDENVIYSFHFYNPYSFTHQADEVSGTYPGIIKDKYESSHWDKDKMRFYFESIEKWRKKNNIPKSNILCGEFNTCRFSPGASQWLLDLLNLLEEYGYNWTYYMFREDSWDYMDSELGTNKNNKKRSFSSLMKIFYNKFKHNKL